MDTMDGMDKNGLLNGQWTMDRNGHVQQVTSLNLSIRPSNGKSIASFLPMKKNENALMVSIGYVR